MLSVMSTVVQIITTAISTVVQIITTAISTVVQIITMLVCYGYCGTDHYYTGSNTQQPEQPSYEYALPAAATHIRRHIRTHT